MTKSEFETKFNNICVQQLKKYADEDYLKNELKKYADDNGHISNSSMMSFALLKSCEINQNVLKDILEHVLEFDE